jgi:hypothetical protein
MPKNARQLNGLVRVDYISFGHLTLLPQSLRLLLMTYAVEAANVAGLASHRTADVVIHYHRTA